LKCAYICEGNNSADTKVSEEGVEGGARDAAAQSLPLQLVEKIMVRQAVPLQSMEVHCGAEIHLYPMEGTPRRSRWMPGGGCDHMGSPMLEQAPTRTCRPMKRGAHARAGLLAGLVTPWGTHAGPACS